MEGTNVENAGKGMDLLEYIRTTLISSIKTNADGSSTDHVSVIKRNKELSKGDFVVMAKGKSASSGESGDASLSSQMTKALENSKDLQIVPHGNPSECYIKLQRSVFYRKVLNNVMTHGNKYGAVDKGAGRKIGLNCVLPTGDGLEALRCLFLTEHIGNLLHTTGYTVSTSLPTMEHSWLEDFNIQLVDVLEETSRPKVCDMEESLEQCQYKHSEDSRNSEEKELIVNIRKFMTEHKVITGKDGYDKNLQLIKLTKPLLNRLCDVDTACRGREACVHVVTAAQEYTQQQMDLVWRALHTPLTCSQHHEVAGSVTGRKSGAETALPTVEQFLKLRHEEMIEASKLKYGDQVTGSGWMDTIMSLTVAGIKFEFLSTSCRSQLKVDVCKSGTVDSGGGVFVMYNYARLATLQDKFQQAVDEGIYPDVPSEEKLDFTTLKDEEEWSLLFNYLLAYPALLKDCVTDMDKLRGPVQTHKICHFLSDLCRELSSYYRRVRILTDPRPHLYPSMHCRLYLMRAVQTVMEHALLLLGIQPISQL